MARVLSGSVLGVEPYGIEVEVELSKGVRAFQIVGLPETAVRESRVRVQSALRNSGAKIEAGRVVINLAPADVPKTGSAFDLPMAVGILAAAGQLRGDWYQHWVFLAELSLDGMLRPVRGVLPVSAHARRLGLRGVVVAPENAREAAAVDGVQVLTASTLAELVATLRAEEVGGGATPNDHASGLVNREPLGTVEVYGQKFTSELDMAEVRGQDVTKRAVLLAAAGGHNLLLSGPPGCGKTMVARRLPSILPKLTREEALETSLVYSISGKLPAGGGLLTRRPFRAPHHTATTAAIIGGGSPPGPGEVSLAHNGVLFLDELPEFSRATLESLRQPLEDREVVVARASATVVFPATFMLVGAMNPCPCGYYGHPAKSCHCSPDSVERYRCRLSGPLLDRVDVRLEVPVTRYSSLVGPPEGMSSDEMRAVVTHARARQAARIKQSGVLNACLAAHQVAEICSPTERAKSLLRHCVDVLGMSARVYVRTLRLARSIADVESSERVNEGHVAEALAFRGVSNGEGLGKEGAFCAL